MTLRLKESGYRTVYLNEPLTLGLAPEGLKEYITQRGRWCLGTLQVALLKDGPLRGPGYSLIDRLHYVVLLPPERTCVERVRSRVGHGFTDEGAARHMYGQFAGAHLEDRHVVRSIAEPEDIASVVLGLVDDGSAVWPTSR